MAARFPRQVVIDTQVFKAQNFNFDAKPFKLLKELQEEGRISIYITDVVRNEVLFRLTREVITGNSIGDRIPW